MTAPSAATVHPGFADPVQGAQATFRAVLDALAHPGRIVRLDDPPSAPAPLFATTYALALTLVDFETPLWFDPALKRESVGETLRFHCGCPIVEGPGQADFALIGAPGALTGLDRFKTGTAAYPDRSATLVLQVERLGDAPGATLRGPGIRETTVLDAAPLPNGFWSWWRANHGLYPEGVDLILAAPDRLAALPRSVRVED